MRIGIMTFHWAANHGAVLQTYALCEYLWHEYHADVEVIDYCPRNQELSAFNALKHIRARAAIRKLKELKKERRIKLFRQKLPLSQRFYTNEQLMTALLDYDILITGSDQIWNPYFLLHGEKKITPVYYLNFGGAGMKKLSVSASFGCSELPDECKKIVAPLLQRFSALSVREDTGARILEDLGFSDVQVTADPTALLSSERYLELCTKNSIIKPGSVSKLILRKQSRQTNELIRAICDKYSQEKVNDMEYLSIPDWLAAIRDSKIVVTNSFHCVMMCLKLHTPFVVILENGANAGMNDRFTTLLSIFGLGDRIVSDLQAIDTVPVGIDFSEVDRKMGLYSESLRQFMERNLG